MQKQEVVFQLMKDQRTQDKNYNNVQVAEKITKRIMNGLPDMKVTKLEPEDKKGSFCIDGDGN